MDDGEANVCMSWAMLNELARASYQDLALLEAGLILTYEEWWPERKKESKKKRKDPSPRSAKQAAQLSNE